jgi:hypothetical protein
MKKEKRKDMNEQKKSCVIVYIVKCRRSQRIRNAFAIVRN